MKIAVLCYLCDNDRTLMIHRNSRPGDMHYGKWNAPGGKLEPGETPDECAVREFYEETGLSIETPSMRGVLTFPPFEGEEDWYVFVFTADKFRGKLRKSCHEGDLEWIENSRLKELPLWEGDRIFMEWLKEEAFFSGKFVYSPEGFQSYSVIFHGGKKC